MTRTDLGAALERRLVRYQDLRPCTTAFIDARTPGSERKENFTIIGPGVAENPDQHVHVDIPHGFNIGAARQPPRCVNSQHSHDTAEVFVIHTGRWRFMTGHDARDGHVDLGPGDTISIPTRVFRGFENIGDDVGFMFAVLGGDDPGRVTWAPYVFEQARRHGLVLLESGRLIDTTRGEAVPPDARRMAPTTMTQALELQRFDSAQIAACVLPQAELRSAPQSPLSRFAGVAEAAIIGPANDREPMPAGRMAWQHGFHLRRLRLERGSSIPMHSRGEEEVLLMHSGSLRVSWDGGALTLGAGDVLTFPKDAPRSYSADADTPAIVYVVRGGDRPSPPRFHS